jgi:hypothetical protein
MRAKGVAAVLIILALGQCAFAQTRTPPATQPVQTRFRNGIPPNPGFFPIAVWLQDVRNIRNYQDIGVNLWVGLWKGPTEDQLNALEKAGMPVICSQNAVGLQNIHRKVIVGWMHGDEPDNAQSLGQGKGYGPPIPPDHIISNYKRMKDLDPTRPVFLNLSQGVAWDKWYGRGVRTNKPEDYPLYVQGADILSFDIYPVTHTHKDVTDKLWMVPYGVERLRGWVNDRKPVWTCIECTNIDHPDKKPTPRQVRSMVWMSIIHGAKGIIYFCHSFKPTSDEDALLADKEMSAAVAIINKEVSGLAAVINSPAVAEPVTVQSSPESIPVATMMKKRSGATFVFAAAMRDGPTTATFRVPGVTGKKRVYVLSENRWLDSTDGIWRDDFNSYDVHLYRILTP